MKKYKFDDNIIKEVHGYYKMDNFHGPLELVLHWSIIAVSIFISSYSIQHYNLYISVPVVLISIFIIGARQRGLADILHQSIHGTLAENKTTNLILGSIFSGYMVFQSHSGYKISHLRHHQHLGDIELDPDTKQYADLGLMRDHVSSNQIRSYLKSIISPEVMYRYLKYLMKNRLWSSDEIIKERLLRLSIYTLLLLTLIYFNLLQEYFYFWIIPLFTTHLWIGTLIETLEHYPMIKRKDKIDIYMTRNRIVNKVTSFLLGTSNNEGYHLVHHLFPRVPTYRLIEVHNKLMVDDVYNRINENKGLNNIIINIIDSPN